jgi:hypothetical protein
MISPWSTNAKATIDENLDLQKNMSSEQLLSMIFKAGCSKICIRSTKNHQTGSIV